MSRYSKIFGTFCLLFSLTVTTLTTTTGISTSGSSITVGISISLIISGLSAGLTLPQPPPREAQGDLVEDFEPHRFELFTIFEHGLCGRLLTVVIAGAFQGLIFVELKTTVFREKYTKWPIHFSRKSIY